MVKAKVLHINKRHKVKIFFPAFGISAAHPWHFIDKLLGNLPSYKKLQFRKADYLKANLEGHILAGIESEIKPIRLNEQRIEKIISESLKKAYAELPTAENIELYFFPTYSDFIIKKMGGVSGFTPGKRVIFVYLNPVGKWQSNLAETVVHEFTHTASYKHHSWLTLLDTIIFEGLADVLTSNILKRPVPRWSRALSKDEARKVYSKIKRLLGSKSHDLYNRVFFEGKEFPLWSGYAIGNYIVRDFLAKNNLDWNEIIKLSPSSILKKSGF